ncbi:MAG TPA: TIGR03936 family radical SAM-associated protein [Dehalococcoidia bacterium]|nr:TIGR03936 family radical SAM-associated protein [Dehalococcoidia bacterium]
MKAQRLRFRYRVTEAGCSFSQRELIASWEKAVTDAGLCLAYSEGKRKTAQISMAAPLPQGVTSDGELVEVYLSEPVAPADALRAVSSRFPPGVEPLAVEEIGVQAPSVQSQLRWAVYEVEIAGCDEGEVRSAVDQLLAADTLPSEYRRETRVRQYDLRPLVLDLAVEGAREGRVVLSMRLRAEPEMTGRADQVIMALRLPETARIHRVELHTDDVPAAVVAFRRSGGEE